MIFDVPEHWQFGFQGALTSLTISCSTLPTVSVNLARQVHRLPDGLRTSNGIDIGSDEASFRWRFLCCFAEAVSAEKNGVL